MDNSMQKPYVARCDASVKGNDSVLSNVIVTPNNRLLFRTTSTQINDNSAKAELDALYALIWNARRYHIVNLRVVSDCKSVVDVINSGKEFSGPNAKFLNKTLRKLRKMLKEFNKCVITHKKREHNVYADSLCRMRRQQIVFKKNGGRVNLREAAPVE